jgi:hypothetical protein
MKRSVFASETCCVTLASLRISGPPDDEIAAATALAGACARGAFEGRRTTRVTMLKNTNAMKPIIRASYRPGAV